MHRGLQHFVMPTQQHFKRDEFLGRINEMSSMEQDPFNTRHVSVPSHSFNRRHNYGSKRGGGGEPQAGFSHTLGRMRHVDIWGAKKWGVSAPQVHTAPMPLCCCASNITH